MEQSSISRRAEAGFFAHFDSLLRARATRTAREHHTTMKVPKARDVPIGGFRNDFPLRAFALSPVVANVRGRDFAGTRCSLTLAA
jgi:hypothetical protein